MSAAVNTGAMSSASAAGAAASQAAEDAAHTTNRHARIRARDVVVWLRVLGFGSEPVQRRGKGPRRTQTYNPDGPVRVLGRGR